MEGQDLSVLTRWFQNTELAVLSAQALNPKPYTLNARSPHGNVELVVLTAEDANTVVKNTCPDVFEALRKFAQVCCRFAV